jgi:3-keto-L-gulonate-6-phosphate decarboxylase
MGPHRLTHHLSSQRRKCDAIQLYSAQSSPAAQLPDDIKNVENASSLFVVDLLNMNAWPDTQVKNHMVDDACIHANTDAKLEGHRTTEFTKTAKSKVKLVFVTG